MTTHKERIQASLRGEIIDRPPIALWRHFPVDDQAAGTLAKATLHFQRNYDFDVVKVTPSSSFCVRDWGVEDEWRGDTEGTRQYTKRVIHDPQDWERLQVLDPTAPHLAAQLECLRFIRAELDENTPVLQTIFSPLAQAKNLAANQTLMEHIKSYPEAVMRGLVTIAESTRRFVEACLETGIDGIFFAIQHAQANLLTVEEYRTFGLTHDLRTLEPAGDLWCNLLHLHGHNIDFSLANNMKFPIVNWHDRETSPSLEMAQHYFPGVTCGGLRQDTLVFGNPMDVEEEALNAIQRTGGKRFILATGCVVPIIAPHGNIVAARKLVEGWIK
jgi:uroporphyrinogen decarboxylase